MTQVEHDPDASSRWSDSFDFCAKCVKAFLKEHFGIDDDSEDKKDLVLGFTVSSMHDREGQRKKLALTCPLYPHPPLQFSYPCS